MHLESGTFQHVFQHTERTGIRRGHRCYRRQRVGAEPVRPFPSSQAEQFDKAPDAHAETERADKKCQGWVVYPDRELVEQARSNEKTAQATNLSCRDREAS